MGLMYQNVETNDCLPLQIWQYNMFPKDIEFYKKITGIFKTFLNMFF